VIYTDLHDGMKGQALPLKFCLDIIDDYSVQPLRGDAGATPADETHPGVKVSDNGLLA
jgi:hypothetical protein